MKRQYVAILLLFGIAGCAGKKVNLESFEKGLRNQIAVEVGAKMVEHKGHVIDKPCETISEGYDRIVNEVMDWIKK